MKESSLLTEKEFMLIEDANILIIKNKALNKIKRILAQFQENLEQKILLEPVPFLKLIEPNKPKISRGENYLGLPYLILDYPSHFSNPSILAFRTLFWWGNFYSITLHLQGEALEKSRNVLVQNCTFLLRSDFFICVNETPWEYHYEASNYKSAQEFIEEELKLLLAEKSFIKISYKIPLKDYDKLDKVGLAAFNKLLSLFNS